MMKMLSQVSFFIIDKVLETFDSKIDRRSDVEGFTDMCKYIRMIEAIASKLCDK